MPLYILFEKSIHLYYSIGNGDARGTSTVPVVSASDRSVCGPDGEEQLDFVERRRSRRQVGDVVVQLQWVDDRLHAQHLRRYTAIPTDKLTLSNVTQLLADFQG